MLTLLSLFPSPSAPPDQESDYFTPQGEFRVDKAGSPTLLNCLMYKMSYYRFGEMQVLFICSWILFKWCLRKTRATDVITLTKLSPTDGKCNVCHM